MECYFVALDGGKQPYVRRYISHDISGGYLEYDGYFYEDEEELPKMYMMDLNQYEDKPYKVENGTSYYKCIFRVFYKIEILKKESFEDTSVFSKEVDEDGEEMNVCFFPTERQKLWFRVVEDLTSAPPSSPAAESP